MIQATLLEQIILPVQTAHVQSQGHGLEAAQHMAERAIIYKGMVATKTPCQTEPRNSRCSTITVVYIGSGATPASAMLSFVHTIT